MNNYCIDVGIPVYNEEDTITYLLYSIYMQKDVQICRTIIVNDGSTDNTLQRILSINEKIKQVLHIKVINLHKNFGKANALNIIFREADSEVLVLIDADVVLTEPNTLKKLTDPIISDPEVCLVCGGYDAPLRGPIDFIARAYRFSVHLTENIALRLNNMYGARGVLMAIRKECYKYIKLPLDVIRDDAYIYLFIKYISKKKFIFNPEAKVMLFKPEYNIKRYIYSQAKTRIIPSRIYQFFGRIAVVEHRVPIKVGIESIINAFLKEPLGFLSWCIAKTISHIMRKRIKVNYRWKSINFR